MRSAKNKFKYAPAYNYLNILAHHKLITFVNTDLGPDILNVFSKKNILIVIVTKFKEET